MAWYETGLSWIKLVFGLNPSASEWSGGCLWFGTLLGLVPNLEYCHVVAGASGNVESVQLSTTESNEPSGRGVAYSRSHWSAPLWSVLRGASVQRIDVPSHAAQKGMRQRIVRNRISYACDVARPMRIMHAVLSKKPTLVS